MARRTCVGCRRQADQVQLMRVVRTPEGTVVVGRALPGRGAWLCAGSVRCLERAARSNAMSRALRAPVTPEAVLALGPAVKRVTGGPSVHSESCPGPGSCEDGGP